MRGLFALCLLASCALSGSSPAGSDPSDVPTRSAEIPAITLDLAEPPTFAPAVDLSGRWVMTLPAGWQRKVEIAAASKDTWSAKGTPGLVFNGVYELRWPEGTFVMLEADDPAQPKFEWELLNVNTMRLVHQEVTNGGNYLGATLNRVLVWEEVVDNSTVPVVPPPGRNRRSQGGSTLRAPVATPELGMQVVLVGTALNDEESGPYLESEDILIFVDLDEPWPEEAVGKRVQISGRKYSDTMVIEGEAIPIERIRNVSWRIVEDHDSGR